MTDLRSAVRTVQPSAPVFIVTGAAGNLGSALSHILAASGAHVVAIDRQEAMPASLPAGGDAQASHHLTISGVDLLDIRSCEEAVAAVLDKFGRIDGIGHTVGGYAPASIIAGGASLWERMYRLNVTTTVNILGAALPSMIERGRGSLVATGAAAARGPSSGNAAYASAKGALHKLIEDYANELAPSGIRVNAVLPGIIDTPINRAAMPDADFKSWIEPRRIAAVMAFLLSETAIGVSGALVPVTSSAPAATGSA